MHYVCDVLVRMCVWSYRELRQWEMASETMKDLKANMVGKPLPKTFATFGAHSALAAAMIVPVSIAIRLVICMHLYKKKSVCIEIKLL